VLLFILVLTLLQGCVDLDTVANLSSSLNSNLSLNFWTVRVAPNVREFGLNYPR
jgi:hypothetical protein